MQHLSCIKSLGMAESWSLELLGTFRWDVLPVFSISAEQQLQIQCALVEGAQMWSPSSEKLSAAAPGDLFGELCGAKWPFCGPGVSVRCSFPNSAVQMLLHKSRAAAVGSAGGFVCSVPVSACAPGRAWTPYISLELPSQEQYNSLFRTRVSLLQFQ